MYEVIESKCWQHIISGATASIYGALPWTRDSDRDDWEKVQQGWTVRNTSTGIVGVGRVPWTTLTAANLWCDAENARLAEIAARYAK